MAKEKTIYVCSARAAMKRRADGQMPWLQRMEHAGGAGTAGCTDAPVGAISSGPARSERHAPFCVPEETTARATTGIGELDALGGGVVEGSLMLVGGDPASGKSTLLLQASEHRRGRSACPHGR